MHTVLYAWGAGDLISGPHSCRASTSNHWSITPSPGQDLELINLGNQHLGLSMKVCLEHIKGGRKTHPECEQRHLLSGILN